MILDTEILQNFRTRYDNEILGKFVWLSSLRKKARKYRKSGCYPLQLSCGYNVRHLQIILSYKPLQIKTLNKTKTIVCFYLIDVINLIGKSSWDQLFNDLSKKETQHIWSWWWTFYYWKKPQKNTSTVFSLIWHACNMQLQCTRESK